MKKLFFLAATLIVVLTSQTQSFAGYNVPITFTESYFWINFDCKLSVSGSGTVTVNDDGTAECHGTMTMTWSGDCFGLEGTSQVVTFSDTRDSPPRINLPEGLVVDEATMDAIRALINEKTESPS